MHFLGISSKLPSIVRCLWLILMNFWPQKDKLFLKIATTNNPSRWQNVPMHGVNTQYPLKNPFTLGDKFIFVIGIFISISYPLIFQNHYSHNGCMHFKMVIIIHFDVKWSSEDIRWRLDRNRYLWCDQANYGCDVEYVILFLLFCISHQTCCNLLKTSSKLVKWF